MKTLSDELCNVRWYDPIVWGDSKDDRLVILTYCQSLMVNYAIFNGGAKAINQRTYNNFCGG